MNGDRRDPLDDAIARDLGAIAPDDLDADAVLGSMGPALHRARARRRAAVTSGVVGALVVVVGVGALLAGQRENRVQVEGHPTTLPSTTVTPTTRRSNTSTTLPPSHDPTSTTLVTSTTPTTTTAPTTPTTDDHGGTSQPGPGSTTAPPAPPSTKTYSSTGGRITVTFAHGALTLDSSKATAGYQADVRKQDPDDVEVRFSNGNRESRIRIRVQNGTVQKEITEN